MEQTPWEANNTSAIQEIPRIWGGGEPERSLSHSQEVATLPYPEPDQSSPCTHSISWRS
jgi:hypothetical protein